MRRATGALGGPASRRPDPLSEASRPPLSDASPRSETVPAVPVDGFGSHTAVWRPPSSYAAQVPRTDRASRLIAADPEHVYAALVDPGALSVWLAPQGMTARF